MASALAGKPAAFINSDVMLDSEPVIGSFTVDGLTYAVIDGPYVELVNVAPMVTTSEGDAGAVASGLPDQANDSADSAAPSEAAEGGEAEGAYEGRASEAGATNLILPEAVSYEGVSHIVSSVGAYAFYLSGVASVTLPASVSNVDDRAFRSSDVASVGIAEGNPFYASYDGVLYDATLTSLLLIPGGRQGAVRISSKAEEVDASAFSHCAGVSAISADAGSAHFSSWDGLLYDADGTTLLRVPAGATDITIREGCTTIAAGALEACAKLATITAPATVTSISPDALVSVSTMSLPVATLTEEPVQLSAIVALSTTDDDLPKVNLTTVEVRLEQEADVDVWKSQGFSVSKSLSTPEDTMVDFQDMESYAAGDAVLNANGGTIAGRYNTFVTGVGGGTWVDAWDGYAAISGSTAIGLRQAGGNVCYLTRYDDSGGGYTTQWVIVCYYNGVRFIGLSSQATGGSQTSDGYTVLSNCGTIYAVYPTSSFSLDKQGGSGGTSGPITARVANAMPTITPPTRPGYAFNGYWSQAGGKGVQYYTQSGLSARKWDTVSLETLYASWIPNSYTVEYWNKAGTTKLSSDTGFKYDTARNLAAKPTTGVNAGYTAVGWAASANQSAKAYDFGSSQKNLATSGTKKLYLAETANTITLTWNSQGGSAVSNTSKTYAPGAKVPMPSNNPTKAGYTFKGWYTAASGGTQITSNTALPTSNATYHAQWTKKASFAVTLDKASGTGGTSTVYYWPDKGYTMSSTSTTVIAAGSVLVSRLPTRAGYAFAGYYSAASGGTQYVDSSGKRTTSAPALTAAATWHAHWTKKASHAVTLNKNNGTGGTSTVYYWPDKGYTTSSTSTTVIASGSVLVSSLPTRTGYRFDGYYSTATGGTQYIDAGGKLTSSAPALTAAATWYAHWTANSYTVEYWNKAGTTKLSSDTGFKYDTLRNLAAKPTSGVSAGYTAVGWATYPNQSAKVYDFGLSWKNLATSGTKKLYLAETANTITLTWNSQGGSAVGNTSKVYASGAKVPMPADNPTKAGYTFAGWWTAATGGTQVTSSTALPTANATYHAHWSLNPYAITYDLAGGSVSGNPTTYDVTTATFTLKNPTRTGYAFAGWSGTGLSGSANKTVTIAKGSTGNRTYTANWTKNAVHRITLDAQGGQGGTEGFYQWTGKGFYASGSPTDATEPMASITAPIRAGYAYAGYWSGAGGTGTQRIAGTSLAALPNTTFSGPATLYAKWEKVASLRVDLKAPDATSPGTTPVYYWPGCGYTLSAHSTDVIAPGGSLALTLPRRQGYIFSGYYDAPSGGTQMIDAKGALTSHAPALSSAAAWHAQWAPAVSADVPLEVEARVDVLGMEEQAPGSGYIESRCGEPLKVAEVSMEPLPGAAELFGAGNEPQVQLQALAGQGAVWQPGGANASFAFSLGASATEADPARLAPFAMPAYQDRVPVSYRFDIPEALLSTLAEATKPVCSVAYTVALQNPPT